ncbi:hypothetical protein PL11_001845 [Lentilactobacillus curieae]|uniref:Uncharacterized protein n=1 Tax=Lentilactobacillus curieae TaxID=1138822 RepID=A0A1S6QGJ7_9LACO|nr:hypothetical protein [Lentilactobacillus curieae]AQW20746.1 hypothetical protein PL11_001845 [Lentilactobacillus curieae]
MNNKVVKVALLTLAFSGVMAFESLSNNETASAKSSYIPSPLRGTWYSYSGHGHYDRITFYRYRVSFRDYYSGRYHYVKPTKFAVYPYNYKGYTQFLGWHQTAGDGDSYKVRTIYRNGSYHKQLVCAGGAGYWVYKHYYRGHVHWK